MVGTIKIKENAAGDGATMTIDYAADPPESKSGKSHIAASTQGFLALPSGRKVSLNITE